MTITLIMKHVHFKDIDEEQVKAFGSEKTTVRWFTKKEDSKYFMMRKFEIDAGGHIGVHQHLEEHQMYVLKGPVFLIDKKGDETIVESEEFVYMPSNEPHGYTNPNDHSVSFICCIPNLNIVNDTEK